MKKNHSFCIHAHFYQPPREDPFTGQIPDEPGAAPYHNWNEQILATCYQPNSELRNFSRISYNIGPTLVEWMKQKSPETLATIVREDSLNQAIYGSGNAMAQAYHHSILPLLTKEDMQTQIKWGIAAFSSLYKRAPEGMWLPETAVNTDVLLALSENGIRFTILAPWQVDVEQGHSPFCVDLENGKSIYVFVYHGGLSSTMSFDTFATGNADSFAEFYLKPEVDPYQPDQYLMIATDGELYGHHQPFRDQFLAHLLNGSTGRIGMRPTWPGLWLKQNSVHDRGRIVENTSWSCHHGLSRWREECACSPGASWKQYFKQALDGLNQLIYADFTALCNRFGINPVEARNDYIHVVLGEIPFAAWIQTRTLRTLNLIEVESLCKVFQAQFACQEMFTSCAWFHGSLSRIEPRNSLIYAAHATFLMTQVTGKDYTIDILPVFRKAVDVATGETAADIFVAAIKRFADNPVD